MSICYFPLGELSFIILEVAAAAAAAADASSDPWNFPSN